MKTREHIETDESPEEVLRITREKHSRILEEWNLAGKARRYLVEKANDRSIEDELLGTDTIVLGSTIGDASCLYLGFQRSLTEGDTKTKVVLIGVKSGSANDYTPDPNSYFDDTDCRVASELFDELTELQRNIFPSYDLQFGIVR